MTTETINEMIEALHEALNGLGLATHYVSREYRDGSAHSAYDCIKSSQAIVLSALRKAEGVE